VYELGVENSDRDVDDEESGFDAGRFADVVGYVLRAPQRRPWRFGVLLAVSLLFAITVFALYPRTYSTEVKILAQRNLVLPALGNPNRTVPREADNPTKNVADAILQHDNLVGLIKQVDLVDRWELTRPFVLRAKDRVAAKLGPPQTEQERMRSIEGVLEKRLVVTSDDTTITISSEWNDPHMAYDIASAVEHNFIDARYDAEISVINDAIAILEQHANEEKQRFDQAQSDFESVELKTPKAPKSTTSVSSSAPPHATRQTTPPVDPELMQSLEETRSSIQQLENARASRVSELSRQMSDALVTYRPEHPTVVALKAKLAEAQADPPDLARLKSQERGLIDKLAVSAPPLATAIASASTSPHSAATIAALAGGSSSLVIEEDPAVTVSRMALQQSAQKYSDLETRIDGAKIELDIAKTAHKYRYDIVRPAEVSRRASKPNPIVLFVALALLVLVVSFGGIVFFEWRRGVVVEPWQVERRLKLPILAELGA
jgi:hypothetical protein